MSYTTMNITNDSYFLYFHSKNESAKTVLIIPNSAGYFAKSPKYDRADLRINKFCEDLSKTYKVYYLVLPGQGTNCKAKYTYSGSIEAASIAITYLTRHQRRELVGVIGMCTGGAIAVEALLSTSEQYQIPLILYNTAVSVGWNDPRSQRVFLRKYKNAVKLDCEELKSAPAKLAPVISKYHGRILQIACGNSDYKIELQQAIKIPGMETKTFMTMSDVPISESEEYVTMLDSIQEFFK